jgi:glycosyltransferase involved in cell wall biosynthesis
VNNILNPKKLLVDAHIFDENHQGIRTFLKGIYNVLDINPLDIQVYLAANNIKKLKQEFKHQSDFKYIQLKSKNKYVRLAFELPRLIKNYKIDFAHFNYYLPLFLSKKCRYIVTIHDVLFIDFPQYFPIKYRLLNTFLFKRSAIKAEILTTVSKYSAGRIRSNFNIDGKSITVLPNAIDEIYKQDYNKAEDRELIKNKYQIENFIIYVSRIEPRKNHSKLIQAYRELRLWEQGLSLVLIGKESFIDLELKQLIAKVNQDSNGKLYQFDNITNSKLIAFYNAAQLAVFPSLCEGFGIPPIESAVLKTPTICSNSTAMKDFDFFEDNLIDATSKESIKLKIVEALDMTNNNEFIYKVSEIIRNKYCWQHTANILKELIINDK